MERDRGVVTLWVALLVMVVAAIVLGLGRLASLSGHEGRAQSVADLVALAGVDGGEQAATVVAVRNGARITSFREDGETVHVVVETADSERRSAQATAEP